METVTETTQRTEIQPENVQCKPAILHVNIDHDLNNRLIMAAANEKVNGNASTASKKGITTAALKEWLVSRGY